MRSLIVFIIMLISQFAIAQYYEPQVILADGTILKPNKIVPGNIGRENAYVQINDTISYTLESVKSFQYAEHFYLVKNMGELGWCALRRIQSGDISTFSFSKHYYDPNFGGGEKEDVNVVYTYNKQMKILNMKNLKADLSDQDKALEGLKKINRVKWARIGLSAAGIGLFAYGISEMFVTGSNAGGVYTKFQFNPNAPFFIGILLGASPYMLFDKSDRSLIGFVERYNSGAY